LEKDKTAIQLSKNQLGVIRYLLSVNRLKGIKSINHRSSIINRKKGIYNE